MNEDNPLCPPSVTNKNKNTKEISVSFRLLWGLTPVATAKPIKDKRGEGASPYKGVPRLSVFVPDKFIPVKARAFGENWLRLEKIFLNAYQKQKHPQLKTVLPYLSKRTPKKTLDALKRSYKDDPAGFMWDFYYRAVEPAAGKVKATRPRGGNPYGMTWEKSADAKRDARWVYLFLSHWGRKPKKKHPDGLTNFLKRKNISKLTDEQAKMLTIAIIEERYDKSIKKDKFKVFYDTFIISSPLSRIKQALKSINYQPSRYPLSDIFP